MTTTTLTRRPVVKQIADFGSRGLIGRWFGALQLVAVRKPAPSKRGIGETLCRVTCENAHMSTRTWWYLRDQSRKQICGKCTPKEPTVTNLSNERLLREIAELTPQRRRLFDVLLSDRQQAPGQEDTSVREMVNDAYAYAKGVKDPEGELTDLLAPEGGYDTYGRSSLGSPNLIYVAVE